MTRAVVAYQCVLLLLTALLLAAALPWGLGNPYAVVGLALIAAVAERGRVKLDNVIQVSISVLPTVFAAAIFGPLAAMVVAAASYVGDLPLRDLVRGEEGANSEALRWGVHTCIRAIYGAVAGFAAAAASHVAPDYTTTSLVVATVTAALVAESLDLAFGAITATLRTQKGLLLVKTCAPMYAVSVCLYTPIVAALTVAYTQVSPWTLPLFFVPALAAQRLFGLYQEQRQLAGQR